MPARRDRRDAEILGRRAEWVARWLLRLKGYRILALGYRVPAGEIDIVARRGRVLAIIEVKVRRTLDQAAWSIGPRQRRRIERAAEAFIGSRPMLQGMTIRFDAVLVSPNGLPRHLPAAWTTD